VSDAVSEGLKLLIHGTKSGDWKPFDEFAEREGNACIEPAVCACEGGHGDDWSHSPDVCRRLPATHHQSRADSIIEVTLNILIGAAVSLVAQLAIFPLYGIHASAGQHVGIVGAFTVVSVARQYVIRRICNGRSPWAALKGKFYA